MPYAICLLYPPLSHTDYIQIYHLCLLGMMVSNAWHEADPHYAELVSVGIGSQPHSPPLPLPPFQIPSRYIKHLIFQSLVLPISTPFSSVPGPYIYDLPTSNSGFPWEGERESHSLVSSFLRTHGLQSMEFSRPEYWHG